MQRYNHLPKSLATALTPGEALFSERTLKSITQFDARTRFSIKLF